MKYIFIDIQDYMYYTLVVLRGMAQLVAHLLWEQGVASSSPAAPTSMAQ